MKVVVYSHDADTRARMQLAIGRRPAPDVPEAEIIPVATEPALIRLLDAGGADVMVLDGEAQPAGGMGVCRQAKDEIHDCPPVLLVVGRADDGWLATWSGADAVTSHPIDPVAFAAALAGLMRQRAEHLAAQAGAERAGERADASHRAPGASWRALIGTLIRGETLSPDEAAWAMNEIMEGAATPVQVAGFARGPADEGRDARRGGRARRGDAAPRHPDQRARRPRRPGRHRRGRRAHGEHLHHGRDRRRGGRRAGGQARQPRRLVRGAAPRTCSRRSAWSIDLPPAASAQLAEETGIAFLFAPLYHPALRHASVARGELGVPTVFNFLGPVSNPARPRAQAVGVADPRMGGVIAGVLAGRGCSALVFHGDDGLDELTPTTTSTVWVVHDGAVTADRVRPRGAGPGPGPAGGPARRGPRRTTRRWPARCWAVSRARCGTSCC